MQQRVEKNVEEIGKCGCGRSPTGKCIGWHGLSESDYKQKLQEYNDTLASPKDSEQGG